MSARSSTDASGTSRIQATVTSPNTTRTTTVPSHARHGGRRREGVHSMARQLITK